MSPRSEKNFSGVVCVDRTGKEPKATGSRGPNLIFIVIALVVVALLIGVAGIAVATYFYLGVYSAQPSAPRSCTMPSGMTCYDYSIDTDGNLNLDLGQGLGRDITVTAMGCGDEEHPQPVPLSRQVAIVLGGHGSVLGGGSGNTLNCCPADGGPCQKHLSISYRYAGSGQETTVYGRVSGPLEPVP